MTLGARGEPVEVKKLTTYTGQDGDPPDSPDGRRMAFSSYRDGDYDVYVMKPAPKGPTDGAVKITNSVADEGDVDWSPDGRQLAFHGNPPRDLQDKGGAGGPRQPTRQPLQEP
jgi:Tol biopolymer transport system component